MLVFEERGKPEYPEKNLSEQGREPTRTKKIKRKYKGIAHDLMFSLTFLARFLCFCNSPSCPQAVCESSQRCFTKLRKEAKDDGNVSSSILYGCSEELNSSDVCTEPSFMLCCDRQLCNMPNMLRSKCFYKKDVFFFQSVTQVTRVLQTEVVPMTSR